jgi:hypothetical protein
LSTNPRRRRLEVVRGLQGQEALEIGERPLSELGGPVVLLGGRHELGDPVQDAVAQLEDRELHACGFALVRGLAVRREDGERPVAVRAGRPRPIDDRYDLFRDRRYVSPRA